MIRVTVEMVPHGEESRKFPIGKMELANDGTGTPTHGNYNVRLFRRGAKDSVRKTGRVERHPRQSADVFRLVGKAIKAVLP